MTATATRPVKIRTPKVPSRNVDFPDELGTPSASVLAAIQAANYAQNGAPFDPFLIKFAAKEDFAPIWTSERGDNDIQFSAYQGNRTDGFLPLGDYGITNDSFGTPFGTTPIMLLGINASIDPAALAHPTDFTWILNDHGSGNPNDITYWWPVAPPGYAALGIALSNDAKPDVNNYWCVKTDYLQAAQTEPYWNDSGQHWKSWNGDLSLPVLAPAAPGNSLLLTPTTVLSDQYTSDVGTSNAFCLVVNKLLLPISTSPVPIPAYDPSFGAGTTTAQGIVNVAVLPANIVSDANAGADPQSSPFYYLAGQGYYACTNAFSAPAGGSYTTSLTIGTDASSSSQFQQSNSVTVSAQTGISAGDAGGFNAEISVSYTYEMSVTTSQSVDHDTQTTQTVQLNLPSSPRVLIWQKNVQFLTYRTDGTAMNATAVYQNSDTYLTYQSSASSNN